MTVLWFQYHNFSFKLFNRFAISQTGSYGVARPTLSALIPGVLEAGSQARHQLSLLAEALL